MTPSATVGQLVEWQKKVCNPDGFPIHSKKIQSYLKENPDLCLEFTYITELLKSGYELPADREVNIIKTINGYETGWCLGAGIKLLEDYRNAGGLCIIS